MISAAARDEVRRIASNIAKLPGCWATEHQ
jgi:hypothetical protein